MSGKSVIDARLAELAEIRAGHLEAGRAIEAAAAALCIAECRLIKRRMMERE